MATSTGSAKETSVRKEEFTYLPPPQDFLPRQEGVKEKFIRKTKENPFVPLGVVLTTFALSYGMWQMKTGNRRMSQNMMRLRVFAQGFTVVAVLAGVYASSKAKK